MAYINLFPTYANNQQLGNRGRYGHRVPRASASVRRDRQAGPDQLRSLPVRQRRGPGRLFPEPGDDPPCFAMDAGLPFLNIVQACSWTPVRRVPNADEMRYLVYTTLAYGAQGISYYVYCWPGHDGGIALPDGTPTPIYHALKTTEPRVRCHRPAASAARFAGSVSRRNDPRGCSSPCPTTPRSAWTRPCRRWKSSRCSGYAARCWGTSATQADHPRRRRQPGLPDRVRTITLVGPGDLGDLRCHVRQLGPGGRPPRRIAAFLVESGGGGKLLRLAEMASFERAPP
jgi:hypothetical protein